MVFNLRARAAVAAMCCIFLAAMFASGVRASEKVIDLKGTLQLILPSGEMMMLSEKDTLPGIPDKSTITVFSGSAVLSASGESLKFVVGDSRGMLKGQQSVKIEIEGDRVFLTAMKGTISLKKHGRKTIKIKKGQTISLPLFGEEEKEELILSPEPEEPAQTEASEF